MNNSIEEFLKKLEKTACADQNKVLCIEAVFGFRMSALCEKIVSYQDEALFFDSKSFLKLLSYDEIIHAEEELQVPFTSMKLIPIFDVGDNDFICYDGNTGYWCYFNVIDEITFKETQQLEVLLAKYKR